MVAAVKQQLDLLPLSSRVLPHGPIAKLGKMLAEITPESYSIAFLQQWYGSRGGRSEAG